MIKTAFVTYGFVTDESGKLVVLITMRDLLFSAHDKKLAAVMLADPFCLNIESADRIPCRSRGRHVCHRDLTA